MNLVCNDISFDPALSPRASAFDAFAVSAFPFVEVSSYIDTIPLYYAHDFKRASPARLYPPLAEAP